jgi:hypothetical protein
MMKKQKQKKVLAIYLNPKLHDEITRLANYEHRSLSGQVSYMLTKHLQYTSATGSLTIDGKGGIIVGDGDTPNNLTFKNID